ncbi:MAG: hypothetical protein D3924_16600, partial [Candidatus Electrothrix sp. AR4]|nr:hypothetical protein [Candidatus Electrothrix sp. AR4]
IALLINGFNEAAEPAVRPKLCSVIGRSSWLFIFLYMLTGIIQTFFRTIRYKIILENSVDDTETLPGIFHLFIVTMSRNMFVDMLPARLGELSYVAMLNQGFKIGTDSCLSSLAISFVFDLIALALLLLGLTGFQLLFSNLQPWLISTSLLLIIISALLLLLLFPVLRWLTIRLSGFHAQGWSGKKTKKLITLIKNTSASLQQVRQKKITGRVLALSMGVRIFKYLGLYLLFSGVVFPSFPNITRDISHILITLVSAEASAGLPVPSFMSFGTYEAGGTLALVALGAARATSVVVMLALHIWSQTIDYLLGSWAFTLFILFVLGGRSKTNGSTIEGTGKIIKKYDIKEKIWLIVALITLVASLFFFTFQLWSIRKSGAFHPPNPGKPISTSTGLARKTNPVLEDLHGFVIWSSNRFGIHDLVMLTLPKFELTQLTTHPHTEYFPRISPDGTKVVFCRSQEPWVSQRNKEAWDTWLLDLATGTTRLLAKNANTPTWSADGKKIYFLRKASLVVEYTLANQKETVVFETGKNLSLNASITLETPDWSEARQALAVTLRGGTRGTFVIDNDRALRKVGKGCELTWSPDSSFLYQVDHGKRGGNAFFKVAPDTMRQELWYDAPGEYSHEYF